MTGKRQGGVAAAGLHLKVEGHQDEGEGSAQVVIVVPGGPPSGEASRHEQAVEPGRDTEAGCAAKGLGASEDDSCRHRERERARRNTEAYWVAEKGVVSGEGDAWPVVTLTGPSSAAAVEADAGRRAALSGPVGRSDPWPRVQRRNRKDCESGQVRAICGDGA